LLARFREALNRCPIAQLPAVGDLTSAVESSDENGRPDDEAKRREVLTHAASLVTKSTGLVSRRQAWELEVPTYTHGREERAREKLTSSRVHSCQIQQRTYFHYAPLKPTELQTWHSYLDFEEADLQQAQDDTERAAARRRVEQLYERCLIVCVRVAVLGHL